MGLIWYASVPLCGQKKKEEQARIVKNVLYCLCCQDRLAMLRSARTRHLQQDWHSLVRRGLSLVQFLAVT